MRYLQLCPQLTTLILEGNLVCLQPAAGPASKVWELGTQAACAGGHLALGASTVSST